MRGAQGGVHGQAQLGGGQRPPAVPRVGDGRGHEQRMGAGGARNRSPDRGGPAERRGARGGGAGGQDARRLLLAGASLQLLGAADRCSGSGSGASEGADHGARGWEPAAGGADHDAQPEAGPDQRATRRRLPRGLPLERMALPTGHAHPGNGVQRFDELRRSAPARRERRGD